MKKSEKHLIVACPKSGTHWLGRIITSDTDFVGTPTDKIKGSKYPIAEIRRMNKHSIYFNNVLKSTFPEIIKYYKKCHHLAKPKHYIDKTHGLLWFVHRMHLAFPTAKFINIQRSALPTIASILKTLPVFRERCDKKNWRRYPLPILTLGINDKIAKIYDSLILAERAALFWLSHKYRVKYLKQTYPDHFLTVSYEGLLKNKAKEINKLNNFLHSKIDPSKVTGDSQPNSKYKTILSKKQIRKINNILENKLINCEIQKIAAFDG